MTRSDVVELYKKGFSINYIVNEYYKKANKEIEKNYWSGTKFIIIKKAVNKKEARHFVEEVLLDCQKIY